MAYRLSPLARRCGTLLPCLGVPVKLVFSYQHAILCCHPNDHLSHRGTLGLCYVVVRLPTAFLTLLLKWPLFSTSHDFEAACHIQERPELRSSLRRRSSVNKSRRVWVEGMGFEVSGVFDFMIPEFRLEILKLSFSPACCRSQEGGSCLHDRVLNSVFFRLRGRHPFHGSLHFEGL